MANIKILAPEVFNKISAGEVVENPVGALKELVENSIDAGATRITVEVVGGGLELISVTDNGCGIREDDIELAFYKHATSKLSSSEELSAIQTLGFRGEALSSIAAVSKVKLTTRHAGSETGVAVLLEDGKTQNKQCVSANVGTKIEIRDLFYNTPARKKFLKAPKYEAINITKYVAKLILTNSTLSITYVLDGNTVYQTKGTGLEEALFVIYGKECVENCIKIEYTRGMYRINGFIGAPSYAKANRNYQTLSVNGRIIEDSGVSGAILQAYRPYLMTRKFPFFVLNIDLPCDCVDVNVHPKKSEVRFADNKSVCGAFYRATYNALENYSHNAADTFLTFSKGSSALTSNYPEQPFAYDNEENAKKITELVETHQQNLMNDGQAEDVIQIEEATKRVELDREFIKLTHELEKEISVEKARQKMGFTEIEWGDRPKVSQRKSQVDSEQAELDALLPPLVKDKSVYDDLYGRTRILGAAFKTFLILEIDDKIIFVDQHAAHERILFDKFMARNSTDMQPLMFPYVFTVRAEEAAFIDENIDNIYNAGIEIEPFGVNTYRIKAVATLLSGAAMNEFVQYLLASVDEFKLDDKALLVEKIAQKACKAAVKCGDCLNEYEIKYILKEVCDNNVVQCPHGRPVTVVITKRQLEKMFKRIV